MKSPALRRFGITVSADDDFLLTMALGAVRVDQGVKTSLDTGCVVYTYGSYKAACHAAIRVNSELAWQSARRGVPYVLHEIIDSKPSEP